MHVNLPRLLMDLNQFAGISLRENVLFTTIPPVRCRFSPFPSIVPRFTTGHTRADDCWHHRLHRRSGCGMYGNEVHHLRRDRQTTQESHCHDWRDYPTRWGWGFFWSKTLWHSDGNPILSSLPGLCAIVACSWFAHNVIRAFYNPYTPVNSK